METLNKIVNKLDEEFNVKSFGKDQSFSRFIPFVYDPIGYKWEQTFEKDFTELFNGLMIRGSANVSKVFLAVFPTSEVLERFINESSEGDLLFMHHPIAMGCGDPKGKWGKGFIPIEEKYIDQIQKKKLSIYTCHIPMDCHTKLGPHIAMAQALNAEIIELIEEYILICKINEISTTEMVSKLKDLYEIPYVDFEGLMKNNINTIAIVAGCGDVVDWMKKAEQKGAQAYITGEIHCHIDNDYGRKRYDEMKLYAEETTMSLIGVSHAASEFLVHKTLMNNWFKQNFEVNTVIIPQEKWWN